MTRFFTGEAMFSFSSTSATLLGAGLAATDGLPNFALCEGVFCSADDPLRCGIGVTLCGVTILLAENERVSDDTRPVGVGVAMEGRGFKAGGPIEESTLALPEVEGLVVEVTGPPKVLTRVLFPSAVTLADTDCPVSPESLRSFRGPTLIDSVSVCESADGGLEAGPGKGVALKMEESRRCCATFDVGAGVLPAVPLTPSFLLI